MAKMNKNMSKKIAKITDEAALLEDLSELEHKQWMDWSKNIADSEHINQEREKRWEDLWVPYDDLSEADKDKDREWGNKAIKIVKKYIKGAAMRTRLAKVASVTAQLDKMADEIQKEDPRIALAIDRISDGIEKQAYSPQGWMPGRGMGRGRGHGFGMGWAPGMRFKGPLPGGSPTGMLWCPQCKHKCKGPGALCPVCGGRMIPDMAKSR